MTLAEYNEHCRSLPHATHVVQWGGAHVWKVGGKVFAICWDEGSEVHVTFKCSELSYEILQEMAGCRPAPYLASRGMKWIQRTSSVSVDDESLCAYLAESHRLVAAGLPKRVRAELGLMSQTEPPRAERQPSPASRTTRKPARKATRGTNAIQGDAP